MKMKSLIIGVLTAICALLNVGTITAKAETSVAFDTFKMENGAAARIKSLIDEQGNEVESNGLRFSAEISSTQFAALKEAGARFGVVIVAKDLLKSTVIDENTVFGANPSFYFTNEDGGDKSKIAMLHLANPSCQNIDEDQNIEICGSIVNIQTDNFTRSFVGRAYVAIPQTNAETGETEYTYHFAPYYGGDINNNARCIYYVAQRAIEEEKAEATTLKEKYIKPFETTDRFTKYTYRYAVEHCYVVHDENGEHKIAHTEVEYCYGKLNSTVEAQPIIKPNNVPAIEDLNFVYDLDASLATNKGLVYAAGMQTLRLYYETAATITEEHKHDTLEALIADFLKVENAEKNFGLHLSNNPSDWVPEAVFDPNFVDDPNDPNDKAQQIGIALTTTQNASKNRFLLLSKEFFDKLRAFGVESVSFDFHTAENSGKQMKFYAYQEEDTSLRLPVYDDETGELLGDGLHVIKRVKLYLDDITPGGGVLLEVHQSSSSNTGDYHFGHISFTFPTTNTEDSATN